MTEESIVIDRPGKEIWDYAMDPAGRTLWMTNVLMKHADRDGQPEPGDRARVVAKLAGRRIESVDYLTEVIPGESYAFNATTGRNRKPRTP